MHATMAAWPKIEHPLLRSRQLLPYLSAREDICARVIPVSKFWCECALAYLRAVPCAVRLVPDVVPCTLASDFLDDFHSLKRMLRPGLFAAMPAPSETDPQVWAMPFVQLPDVDVRGPMDPVRGTNIIHVRRSGVEIRGSRTGSRTLTSKSSSVLYARIRVAEGVRDVKLNHLEISGDNDHDFCQDWCVTANEGSSVQMTGVRMVSCESACVHVTGPGAEMRMESCVCERSEGNGVTVEDGAWAIIKECWISMISEDAVEVSGGAHLEIFPEWAQISCRGENEGSRCYCVRSHGDNTRVIVHRANDPALLDLEFYFSYDQDHSPFRALRGGTISFVDPASSSPRKRQKKSSAGSSGDA